MNPQNCFLEARPILPGVPTSYPLDGDYEHERFSNVLLESESEHDAHARDSYKPPSPDDFINTTFSSNDTRVLLAKGIISDGSAAVNRSAGVVPVLNDWLDLAAPTPAKLFATLDYHPPFHCSFCDALSGGIPPGSFCLSGAGDARASVLHCHDDVRFTSLQGMKILGTRLAPSLPPHLWQVSHEAFIHVSPLFQWPAHCVAGSLGARFDPYLRLPNRTTVIKIGTQLLFDDYDTFARGRTSTAPPGKHDMQRSSHARTSSDTLGDHLKRADIQRLFISGLGIDFLVKVTIEAALKHLPNVTIATILPGLQGRFADQTLQTIQKFEAEPRVEMLHARDPHKALDSLCEGTCDVSGAPYLSQCDPGATTGSRARYWCKPIMHQWHLDYGRCQLCPGNGCAPFGYVRGECVESTLPNGSRYGTCHCDLGSSGEGCRFGVDYPAFIAIIISAAVSCLLIAVSFPTLRYMWHKRRIAASVKLRSTGCDKAMHHSQPLPYPRCLSPVSNPSHLDTHQLAYGHTRLAPSAPSQGCPRADTGEWYHLPPISLACVVYRTRSSRHHQAPTHRAGAQQPNFPR